jgi:hypothetical protein
MSKESRERIRKHIYDSVEVVSIMTLDSFDEIY